MSRVSYAEETDDVLAYGRWARAVKSAINGKRGQAALRELEAALVALPTKRLIDGDLCREGDVCLIGAALIYRRMIGGRTYCQAYDEIERRWAECETEDAAADELGMRRALSITLIEVNDERLLEFEPDQRYVAALAWVRRHLGQVAMWVGDRVEVWYGKLGTEDDGTLRASSVNGLPTYTSRPKLERLLWYVVEWEPTPREVYRLVREDALERVRAICREWQHDDALPSPVSDALGDILAALPEEVPV